MHKGCELGEELHTPPPATQAPPWGPERALGGREGETMERRGFCSLPPPKEAPLPQRRRGHPVGSRQASDTAVKGSRGGASEEGREWVLEKARRGGRARESGLTPRARAKNAPHFPVPRLPPPPPLG